MQTNRYGATTSLRSAVLPLTVACLLACQPGSTEAPDDVAAEVDANDAAPADGGAAEDAEPAVADADADAGAVDSDDNEAVDGEGEDTSDADSGSGDAGEVDAQQPALLGTLEVQIDSQGPVPVGQATVSIGEETFEISDGQLTLSDREPGRVVVRVSSAGFLDASIPVDLEAGRTALATLAMLPQGRTFTFDASRSITVSEQNVRLRLPASAFVDASGELVTGPIEATITPFDLEGRYFFPGSMEGEMEQDGTLVPVELLSYGMAEFTFRQGEEELQLSADVCDVDSFAGSPCTVGFQLDRDSTALAAGDEVPFWSYDEARAVWEYESIGSVRESDGQLILESAIDHFSWWNADRFEERENMVCIDVKVVYPDGTPVLSSDARLRAGARSIPPRGYSRIITLADGQGCLLVTAERQWTVYVGDRSGPFASQELYVRSREECPTCTSRAIFVRPGAPCVRGAVVLEDGEPAVDAMVRAWPAGDVDTPPTQTTTDASGQYCAALGHAGSWEISASLLNGTGRLQSGQTTVVVPEAPDSGACGSTDCIMAPTLNTDSRAVSCYAGVARDGSTDTPLPQGTRLHVYTSDGTPSYGIPDGQSPETAYPDYYSTTVVQSGGVYCVDVPAGVGELEMVLDPVIPQGVVEDPTASCGTDESPSYCYANSEVLAEPSEEAEGTRCATGYGVWCTNLMIAFDED